jgi:hypothetical protein
VQKEKQENPNQNTTSSENTENNFGEDEENVKNDSNNDPTDSTGDEKMMTPDKKERCKSYWRKRTSWNLCFVDGTRATESFPIGPMLHIFNTNNIKHHRQKARSCPVLFKQ